MNDFIKRPTILLCVILFSLSACKDQRGRTGGKQGDVGNGGVQSPNPGDSSVAHDTTRKLTDTGASSTPVRRE